MFTGIIQEIGNTVIISQKPNGFCIGIKSREIINKLHTGDSVAVNGICLTVARLDNGLFFADVSDETYRKTALKYYKGNYSVNLELPCTPSSFLSGHFVTGHIDTTAKITSVEKLNDFRRISFQVESDAFGNNMIEKGSISVDGISLTIYDIDRNCFTVSVIPETVSRTNIKHLIIGSYVNIEFDILGKYIIKWLEEGKPKKEDNLKNLLDKSGFV